MGLTRIISDVHFGDRASRVRTLAALRPLLDGVNTLVLNGDTLDTRPGPSPGRNLELSQEVRAFFPTAVSKTHFLTGNHDGDFSTEHLLELRGGAVFLTHGDALFEDIVPWSKDAPLARRLVAAELAALPTGEPASLALRLGAFRRAVMQIPQRHQAEKHGLKYLTGFLSDTIWPPTRVLKVLRAWDEFPARAESLVWRYQPHAQFIVTGHIHRPGIWRRPNGLVVINTGSFCPPLGAYAIDLTADQLIIRRVEQRGGEFHAGAAITDFTLARD